MVSRKRFLSQVSIAAEAGCAQVDVLRRPAPRLALQSIRNLTEIWFIHGNHDTDSDADYDNLWGSELADGNLHGRVVEIAGYRFAGLGGIFRARSGILPSPGRRCCSPRQSTFSATLIAAGFRRRSGAGKSRAALVSHEAPVAAPGARHFGFAAIDELAITLGVRLVVYGHHHRAIEYVREKLMVATAPFRAFGVDMGSHLVWPLDGRGPK
ncbi:metallophosphoesterase [Variovorax paradoxus]|nr:metallophosphoesterase [Variovorax paradoxus]